jgi:outer membrane protein
MRLSICKFMKQERRRSGALCGLLALFLVGMAEPAAAAFSLNNAQQTVYESADEGQRVHFLIERAKMGQVELVNALLEHYPLQGPHAANRLLFIQGLMLESKSDLTGAAEKYRAALARDPSLTLVRVQLVQCLDKLGQDDSAKHHLQLLEAEAPNEEVAGSLRSFIDRINAKRPLTFSGFVSIAPSTNINSGSSHKQVWAMDLPFNINAQDQKQSGVGLAAGLSAGFSKRLGNRLEAVLAADISGNIFVNKDYNSAGLSQSAEMRYHLDNGYLGFGGVAEQSINPNASNLLTDAVSFHSYGPRVSMLRFLGDKNVLHASAVYEWRDYAGSKFLDGTAFLSEASLNHGFDQTFNVTLSGGYDKVNSNANDLSYSTYFGGLGFYKELPLGISLNARGQARFSVFDEEHNSFGVIREDQRYIGSLAITKRDLNFFGFAPQLSYSYTRNASNISLYDYDSHAIDFRLTKEF